MSYTFSTKEVVVNYNGSPYSEWEGQTHPIYGQPFIEVGPLSIGKGGFLKRYHNPEEREYNIVERSYKYERPVGKKAT